MRDPSKLRRFDPPDRRPIPDLEADPVEPSQVETMLDRAVRVFGVTEAFTADGRPSKARGHGHQPDAARHVREYLEYQALGVPVAELAARADSRPGLGRPLAPRHRSTVYRSIRRGRDLVVDRCNPDGREGGPSHEW